MISLLKLGITTAGILHAIRNDCALVGGRRVLELMSLEPRGAGSEAEMNTLTRSAFPIDWLSVCTKNRLHSLV